jgi:hypothetical protein
MNYEKFKKEIIPIESALEQIMTNTAVSFKWFPVNNGVCKFELGGNFHNGELMITAQLFYKDQGKIMISSNGFTVSGPSLHYESYPSLDKEGEGVFKFSLPDINGKYKKMKLKEFLDLLKTDLYQIRYDIEETYSDAPTVKLIVTKN